MVINLHSSYSLRYGTIPVGKLVAYLKMQGHETAVLTDINNSTGILEFIKVCQEENFNGLAGIEFRDGDRILFIGIARNNLGFRELNELLTHCNVQGEPLPETAPDWNHVFVVYPFGSREPQALRDFEFLGVKPGQLTKLYNFPSQLMHKLLMWHPVTFGPPSANSKNEYRLHCQLRAISHNILLSNLVQEQAAERFEMMPTPGDMVKIFSAYPTLIINTSRLLEQCNFHFDFTEVKNKKTYTTSRYDDKLLLEKLAWDGMYQRYGKNNKEAEARVRKELEVINELGFSAYFLITEDMVRYSMRHGFSHVGRGSGANSVVAYCLKITDVDPIELDLYFERFLNSKRKTPPDFDIDYSWDERDQVFDYVFKRYGSKHTALLGMMSTLKDRSIIREIGKVYGLPKGEIDMLVEGRGKLRPDNVIAHKVMAVFNSLPKEFPNLRSIHAGGVLITEEPITSFVALDMPPKGLQTTQFDMYTAEDAGFEKLDILSQRGLGHIKEAVSIIQLNRGKKVDIHDLAKIKADQRVREQLSQANSIGCFYIESPGMQGVLNKLQCDNYLTLVAASSIIRPGVGKSGMMREYIFRYRNPDKFTYPHPIIEEQLQETFGVMIYQEDVLKVGHHFGGLAKEDADVLRRLMSGKTRGAQHLPAIRDKYFTHCKAVGHPDNIAAKVWRQIESFAGYSFSKAHSASFAVESMQSLYLKTYFPREFMVAVINNEGGFYSRWFYIEMARRDGAAIHLPCVNKSGFKTVIYDQDIYLGLNMVMGLETATINRILQSRQIEGPFTDLEGFINRTGIDLSQIMILVRLGALRFAHADKKALRWQVYSLFKKPDPGHIHTGSLFQVNAELKPLPQFQSEKEEAFYDEAELLGFPVTVSMFDILLEGNTQTVKAIDLLKYVGQRVSVRARYVTAKGVRTIHKETMAFGFFMDQDLQFVHTVHFPKILAAYPFSKMGVYDITGKVEEEFGFPTITVDKIVRIGLRADPRFA